MKKYYYRNCNISVYTPGFTEKYFFQPYKNKIKTGLLGVIPLQTTKKQNNKIKGKAKK